jgi:hypothetical protein
VAERDGGQIIELLGHVPVDLPGYNHGRTGKSRLWLRRSPQRLEVGSMGSDMRRGGNGMRKLPAPGQT